jgi:uncharacterized BrkB/YihY/UPF0761 family membrane protein
MKLRVESPPWLATMTTVMSIPLLLSYNIKYFAFPKGYPYVVLYTWGLLSVLVIPGLLIGEFIAIHRILTSQSVAKKRASLVWNILAMSLAAISEVVFLIVRYSSP